MKILIVDDSKAMRMIVKRALRQAGYEDHAISEAGNGVEALTQIQAAAPDLVLSDWNMPEMSGLQLLQAVREQKLGVKLGFVTSEGTPEMRQKAADEGAVFLITKPFTAEAFQAALAGIVS
jgi:two-component system, chemotaxis family, chemotaxis protein CheY